MLLQINFGMFLSLKLSGSGSLIFGLSISAIFFFFSLDLGRTSMEELVLHVGMFPWKLSRHVIGFAIKDLLYTIAALMLLFCFIIHVIAVLQRLSLL